jgi:hypothetical protein
LDGDGCAEAVHGFNCDPKRDGDERSGIDKGSDDAGALVAEGASE